MTAAPTTTDTATTEGLVTWELHGPDGQLKDTGQVHNLVTQVGDQLYYERGAGISGAPAVPTGIKLGAGSTAPAKTGAGAALVTYLSNSHQAFDSGFPASSLNGSARRITYKATFAAGKATTASPITEAVIVNDTLADATSASSATIARVLLTGLAQKQAGDSLTLTWTHDLTNA